MTESLADGPPEDARPHRWHPLLIGLILLLIVGDGWLLRVLSSRSAARAVRHHETGLETSDPRLSGLLTILHRQGLAASLDSLVQRAVRDSALIRNGHQMAHALGRQAVAEHHGDASVIRECRPVFASGCYHGVVEGALQSSGRIDMAQLQRLCVRAGTSTGPGAIYECVHGLGHGVLGAVGYALETALHHCDALSTASFIASCHSGTFMEAISSAGGAKTLGMAHAHGDGHAQTASPPLSIDPANPYSPCDQFRDPYATSCWLFQGFVILRMNDFDAGRALHVCDAAPDGRAGRCYESIGHQLTGLFQHGDAWILEQCARGQPGLAPRCAAGAALALDGLDWSGARATRLCAAAQTDWKEACYRSAAQALTELASPPERARLCASVEAAYVRLCRQAAALVSPAQSR